MNADTVKKLAQLSFLNFTETELEETAERLSEIAESLKIINGFDGEYDPLKENRGAGLNDLREDIPDPPYPMDKLMQNAVYSENCFVVPKVML